jgi:hypothetical protein
VVTRWISEKGFPWDLLDLTPIAIEADSIEAETVSTMPQCDCLAQCTLLPLFSGGYQSTYQELVLSSNASNNTY